jgi:hypothetical protein
MLWVSKKSGASTGNNLVISEQMLDDMLEASFPASDPSAVTIPWTRIGEPRRSK